jgi:hypothetical protein
MALTIYTTSNLSKNTYLLPLYSDIKINVSEGNSTVDNYLFDININDVSAYEYSIQKGYDGKGSLNLSTVLEGLFSTDVSLNSTNYFSNTSAIKKITWYITSRDINLNTLSTYNGLSTASPLYIYNGVISPDEEPYFKLPLSFFPNASQGYWLRKHNAPIKILNYVPGNNINDEHWLSSFNGNFGDCSCNITKLNLSAYKYNGNIDTSSYTVSLTDKSIWTINVNKSSLSSMFGADKVNINTKYLILQDSSAYLKPVRIDLLQKNKINNPYNLIYVNSLGTPECVLFDRNDEKSVSIKRSTYGYYLEKTYYSDIDRFYSVYSSLMSQVDSLSLFDLWISPIVYAENDEFVVPQPVILTNTKMNILNRWNANKTIQYKVDMTCSYRTLNQKI